MLRVCCGTQMSGDYRNRLQRARFAQVAGKAEKKARIAAYAAHRAPDDPSYDACETHDLAAVERALVQVCPSAASHAGGRLR